MSDKTGGFEALLGELGEDLAKAMPADDQATDGDKGGVAAAAAASDEDAIDDGENEETLGKSFELTLDDGTKVSAVDGADLVKALVGRIEKTETGVGELLKSAIGVIGEQGKLLKSLQTKVNDLAGQGRGRRAVLTVAEKPAATGEDLAKAHQDDGISGDAFLAKAMTAMAAGKITGRQLSVAEQYINAGQQPPKETIQAVLG